MVYERKSRDIIMDKDFKKAKMIRRFVWDGYTYELRKVENEIELITYMGQLHDSFIKIEKLLKTKESILKYLTMKKAPMAEYVAIEKVFLNEAQLST